MEELINGRTPEEIKQALEWMANGCPTPDMDCEECRYNKICKEITSVYTPGDALELIERLEAERDAALAKVPKWISVEEQPNPPEDGEYWCHGYWLVSGRKQTEVAEYLGEWKIVNNFILTHWMPLPSGPEEEGCLDKQT